MVVYNPARTRSAFVRNGDLFERDLKTGELVQISRTNGVVIDAVRCAGRFSIDAHADAHRGSTRRWPHDEMNVARVKAVRDAPIRLVQDNGASFDRPVT